MRRDGPAVLVSSPVTLLFSELNNHQDAPGSRFSSGGPSVYPGVLSETTAGLILPGGVVDDMTGRRIAVSEETYKALQAEGLVCGESPAAVLERLVSGGISQKAREVLSAIGEPSAKAEKPKVTKPDLPKARLFDNPAALEEVVRLAAAGHSLRAISEKTGYARATIAENLKRMKAREEEGEGEESTS